MTTTKGGLTAFLRDSIHDKPIREIPERTEFRDWIKEVTDNLLPVGKQFFYLTHEGPVLMEVTEDGCKIVDKGKV